MLYFTLPNFYSSGTIHNLLYKEYMANPSHFKIPVTFIYGEGNFPYQIWNGGLNTNYGTGAYYSEFRACFENYALNTRLNFSNCRLVETDYYDTMGNVILDIYNSSGATIEIADFNLMEYIKNHYENYDYICSRNLQLYKDMTPELIDQLIESEQFKLIGIPDFKCIDFEFLKKIKHKSKIEITINPRCLYDCKNHINCYLRENTNQLTYSSKSIAQCGDRYPYFSSNKQIISVEDLAKNYESIGITHFRFEDFSNLNENNITFNALFLIDYFIKTEYQKDLFNSLFIKESRG